MFGLNYCLARDSGRRAVKRARARYEPLSEGHQGDYRGGCRSTARWPCADRQGASHSQSGHHTGSIAHHNISNWRSHRGEEFFVLRSDPFDTALHRWARHLELQPRPCPVRRRGANRGFQPHRPYRPVIRPGGHCVPRAIYDTQPDPGTAAS